MADAPVWARAGARGSAAAITCSKVSRVSHIRPGQADLRGVKPDTFPLPWSSRVNLA